MYNKEWLKAALIRAVKTFFQTIASYITVGALVSEINWKHAASIALVAFVYSIATSLGGLPEAKKEDTGKAGVDNGE